MLVRFWERILEILGAEFLEAHLPLQIIQHVQGLAQRLQRLASFPVVFARQDGEC